MKTKLLCMVCSVLVLVPSVFAEKSPETRLRLSLRDGSTVVGTTGTEKFTLKTNFGEPEVPLRLLSEVQFAASNATFVFRNNDRLTGQPDAKRIEINSSVGALSIALTNIVRIGISAASKAGIADAGKGLVLHYSFAQGGSDQVEDLSGNGNNGVIRGAKFVADERFGQALDFAGDDSRQCVRVPASDSLHAQTGLSMAAWYRTRSQIQQWIVMWEGGLHMSVHCHAMQWGSQDGAGANLVDTVTGGTTAQTVINTGDSPLNEWHHLAVTFDRNSSRAAVYVDGALRREKIIRVGGLVSDFEGRDSFPARRLRDSRDQITLATTGGVTIGGFPQFDGQIADVQIYNRALTADEIEKLVDEQAAGSPGRATR
jgi:hypothetical protein